MARAYAGQGNPYGPVYMLSGLLTVSRQRCAGPRLAHLPRPFSSTGPDQPLLRRQQSPGARGTLR